MSFGQVSDEHTKIAELSRRIGEILVERGDYEQAMHQFRLGLQYLEGLEHKEVVRIYNEIGRVYWFQGQLDKAQEWSDRAFDLAQRMLDPDEYARLLYYAGIRYYRQGATKRAEDHWLRSLKISQETGDLVMQARLYQNLGWQSQTTGNPSLALERLEKGIHLAEQCGDISGQAWINETLGETFFVLGKWDKAIESFEKSLDLAEQAGIGKTTSRVYSGLGDIYRHRGRWADADECYQRALAALTVTGTPQSVYVVNLSLGLINMERRRYAQAQEFLDKCWNITSQGFGFTSRMATVKAYLGELAIQTNHLDQAQAHVSDAIRLATEMEARRELAHATMVQGIIERKRGYWDKALEHYERAQAIFEEFGDRYNLGRLHAELGALHLNRDGSSQDRALAQRHIAKAREILTELGAKTDLDKLPGA